MARYTLGSWNASLNLGPAMKLEKLLKKANVLSKAIIGSRTEICGIPIFGW